MFTGRRHDLAWRQLCIHCYWCRRGSPHFWQFEKIYCLYTHIKYPWDLTILGIHLVWYSSAIGHRDYLVYWLGNWYGKCFVLHFFKIDFIQLSLLPLSLYFPHTSYYKITFFATQFLQVKPFFPIFFFFFFIYSNTNPQFLNIQKKYFFSIVFLNIEFFKTNRKSFKQRKNNHLTLWLRKKTKRNSESTNYWSDNVESKLVPALLIDLLSVKLKKI